MTEQRLAKQLRLHFNAYLKLNTDRFTPEQLAAIRERTQGTTDRELIESYMTCNLCGKKWLSGPALDAAIAAVESADKFLDAIPRTCHCHN